MAIKKVTYVEPASYFSPNMRKVAREWEKEHANDKKTGADKKTTKKAK